MTKYWHNMSHAGATKDTMMLTDSSSSLDELEVPELLSILPTFTNKDVLEVGCGIGRFTHLLADKAKQVVALDFIEEFIQKNKDANNHYKNIKFEQTDITKAHFSDNSFDLIFSNWILMYLSDAEVIKTCTDMLKWLSNDGYLFIRESCFHRSGNISLDFNPTNYRTTSMYNKLILALSIPDELGTGTYGFNLIMCRSVQAYIKLKNNSNQRCWLLQKTHHTKSMMLGFKTFQEFLDNQQYSRNSILRYERIFGKTFVSTGGLETTKEFVSMLDLTPKQLVLDVGCGIGGGCFYMAKKYDVDVIGIDLSTNMIDIALERANEIHDIKVQFEFGDATKVIYPEEKFDVIYSRDTILHIADKGALFSRFYKWLKPGGKVLISDYCCSEGKHSQQFTDYVKQRGYILLSPSQYGKVLERAGFNVVKVEDRTENFIDILRKEISHVESIKSDYIKEFSEEDYYAIVNGWQDKISRCGHGYQRWGLFYAEKITT